eukprot:2791796-Amphidinium_carterae.1
MPYLRTLREQIEQHMFKPASRKNACACVEDLPRRYLIDDLLEAEWLHQKTHMHCTLRCVHKS